MAKQKQSDRVQFALTRPVWLGSVQLPVGHIVTFEGDEPTGIYKGRCKAVGDVAPAATSGAASAELAAAVSRAEAAEQQVTELQGQLAEALAKVPPAPPA